MRSNQGRTSSSSLIDRERIDRWNATRRFGRAYVDEDGQPTLACDLWLEPVATREAICIAGIECYRPAELGGAPYQPDFGEQHDRSAARGEMTCRGLYLFKPGETAHPEACHVHDVAEVVEGMRGEGRQAESDSDEPYTLAALVMPAKLGHVEAISLHKERMPAKSTYFYPKLLSGLVINPLE